MRNGTQYQTAFIAPSVSVIMVAFSPEYGIASTISIAASFPADDSVDYSVEHFQSLEGSLLENVTEKYKLSKARDLRRYNRTRSWLFL